MKLRLGKKRRGKSIQERIDDLSMPEPNSGCWIWLGALSGPGYGIMTVNGQCRPAHRLSCEAARGPIADHLVVDHLCSNKLCVNPDHLEPVTEKVNMQRSVLRLPRRPPRTHCRKGHEYTDESTIWTSEGRRCCRICNNALQRLNYHRRQTELSERAS